MSKLLTPAEIKQEQVGAMARVFERVNRVLSGRDIICSTEDLIGMEAPAWSDGRTVTFNLAHIGSVATTDDIIKITGLNYHELSHILYSPRGKWREDIIMAGLNAAYNILEDQRIETLLTATYPATKPYFLTTFMRYCLKDRRQWSTVHVLAHGRHYIPANIREQFQNRYERQSDLAQIEKIIDEYRLLVLPRDEKVARRLIEQFAAILRNISQQPSDPFGHAAGRPEVQKGKAESNRDQQDAVEWAEWYDDEDEEEPTDGESGADEDDEDGDDQKGKGKGKPSDEEGEDEGEGEGEGGSDSESEDGDENDSDSEDGHGKGIGSGEGEVTDEDLARALEEIAKKVEKSKQVQNEAKQKQSSIVNGDGEYNRNLPRARYRYVTVDPQIQNVSKKFAKELERIRIDLDPGWNKHQASGRLNIMRAMNSDQLDLDTVFDRWDEGKNDSSDIEAVLFVDNSSSMTTMEMEQACTSAWAIKRAIEFVGGSVTVFMFNTTCSQLYDKNDRADGSQYRFVASTGGTNPSSAIRESFKIFEGSHRHTKLAIFVSDGGWGGGQDMVTRLNQAGIHTAHATIGGGSWWSDGSSNNCQVATDIQNGYDLIPFARQVVTQIMKGKK